MNALNRFIDLITFGSTAARIALAVAMNREMNRIFTAPPFRDPKLNEVSRLFRGKSARQKSLLVNALKSASRLLE